MCQSFIIVVLGFVVTLVQGTFLFAEKKEIIICGKVCPLYCKDHYKKGSQRRWDYDMPPESYDEAPAHKYDSHENYRDTYNFYFGQSSSRPSSSSSTTTTTTTTEEPTLIFSRHHSLKPRPKEPHPDGPSYPSPKDFPPDYEGEMKDIEEEYIYPFPHPYFYYHPHFMPETTTTPSSTTTEEPTLICMICLRKCPP